MMVIMGILNCYVIKGIECVCDYIVLVKVVSDFVIDFGFGNFYMFDKVLWFSGDKVEIENFVGVVWVENVVCNLFVDELVVGFVFVEGMNNIVVIGLSIGV